MANLNDLRSEIRSETYEEVWGRRSANGRSPYERTIPQRVATSLGVFFILFGVIGFIAPRFLGNHLSVAHNFIHLVTGVLSLYFGLWRSSATSTKFCWTFGGIYGVLGISGFIFGSPGIASVGSAIDATRDGFFLAVVPGTLEIGTHDHLMNILVASVFIAGAAAWGRGIEEA